jgi:hypothetical protein
VILLAVLFAAPIHLGLPAGFRPMVIATADFNHDGNIDVALCGESQQLLVFLGDGRGGLHLTTQQARCGLHPTSMIAADLNGDRWPDLAIANHETDYLTVLINDRRGRFAEQHIHVHSVPHPHTVAAADVNGDGRVDLITDSWAENRITLLMSTAPASWRSPGSTIDVLRKPYLNIIAADLDEDGNVDLAMPNFGFDFVSIFFGDGHGHFTPVPQSPIAAGPTPFTIAIGDVNGDGRSDILVANYSGHMTDTSQDGLTWIRNDGGRRFTPFPQRVLTAHGSWRVVSGDLNGDGFADAVITDVASDRVTIAYGSRGGLHAGPSIATMHAPHSVALADLNHDGRADILVISETVDELLVCLSAPGK